MADVVDTPPSSSTAGVEQPAQEVLRRSYELHAAAVARRIAAITGDPDGVADLVQETFLIAWQREGPPFEPSESLGWFLAVATNLARNARRKRARRWRLWARFRPPPAELPPGPEATALARRGSERLLAQLRELPREQAEAFGLRALEGLSVAECAELLGVPASTVSYRARQAEHKLRAAFAGEPAAPVNADTKGHQ